MPDESKLGFYGKIPSKGDFVSSQLPRTFIDTWDQWLQESVASSREQLANEWLNSYLTGPIWRFALSSGVCDENAWTGLVMPSVDSVGRYFPLTLAAPVPEACKLFFLVDNEQTWFSQVEHIALSALDQDNSLDSISQDIDTLGLPDIFSRMTELECDDMAMPSKSADLNNSENWRIAMTELESISTNLSPLLEQFILQRFPEYTLWWTSGSEQVEPSILICNKLPPPQGISALLTGDWDKWGWDNKLICKLPLETKIDNGRDENKNYDDDEDEEITIIP